jgi:hypothetical protein
VQRRRAAAFGDGRVDRGPAAVSDGECERVRGVASRRIVQSEERPDHAGDLVLGRVAFAGDRALHESGCVLEDVDAVARKVQEYDAAGVPELRRGLSVAVEEQGFDGSDRRAVSGDHSAELVVDDREPALESERGVGVDDAVRDVPEPIAVEGHDAPPEVARTGVDAEGDHFFDLPGFSTDGKFPW